MNECSWFKYKRVDRASVESVITVKKYMHEVKKIKAESRLLKNTTNAA